MSAKAAERASRRRAKKPACPICGKPVAAEFRPFCSERCRRIDLDRWLGEAYRVATEEGPEGAGSKRDEEE
jgi:endogenous inhibitor of DNA gyrase (YacG/DUF329 family)